MRDWILLWMLIYWYTILIHFNLLLNSIHLKSAEEEIYKNSINIYEKYTKYEI